MWQGTCTIWLLVHDCMASAHLICIQHRYVACLEHVGNSGLAHPNGPCARQCRASASGASADVSLCRRRCEQALLSDGPSHAACSNARACEAQHEEGGRRLHRFHAADFTWVSSSSNAFASKRTMTRCGLIRNVSQQSHNCFVQPLATAETKSSIERCTHAERMNMHQ